jgi:hypothetical protein
MRFPKLTSLAVAFTGIALFAADRAEAGLDSVCSTCAGQPQAPKTKAPLRHTLKSHKSGKICAECAAKLKAQNGLPPTIVATAPGACAACGAPATAAAPGYAIVGDGSPAPVLASGSAGAPGYAIVGGAMVSAEPTPVGVMRTNYHADGPAQGMPGAGVAANRPGTANVGGIPYAQPNEVPPSLYAPSGKRRHSILAKVIGIPDFGRSRADAEAKARSNHAMTSYGPNAAPSELPASVVYGGR